MKLENILTVERTKCHGQSATKKSVLELTSKMLAEQAGMLAYNEILTKLIERERLGSTGIGHGIAIPHARVAPLDAPIAAFVQLEQGVDFGSSDDQLVDLVFGFIVPEGLEEDHLALISMLATSFNNESFREKLRSADSADTLYRTMINLDEEVIYD